MLPIAVLLNTAFARIPVCFWHQWWLQLWPLLIDALLLVYHYDLLFYPSSFMIVIQKFWYHSSKMWRCSIMLQEAYSLNSPIIKFSENSSNLELLKHILITLDPVRLLPNTPYHTLTGNWCWQWHSAISCVFLCAQECKFFVLVIPSWVN